MNNTAEYQAGTETMDPNSTPFRSTAISRQGNDILITWTTEGGTTNRVQAAPGIASGSASSTSTNLSPVVVPRGSYLASTNYLDVEGATNMPAKYYRVRLGPWRLIGNDERGFPNPGECLA